MEIILFLMIVLAVILFLNYLNQKDFISPTFLMIISFLMASTLIVLNQNNWMIKINLQLFYCVLTAVVSWIFGSALIRLKNRNFQTKSNRKFDNRTKTLQKYKYPYHILNVLSLFLTLIFIIILLKNVDISGGLTSILRNIYEQKATSSSGYFLLHQIEKALIAIAYISVFQLLNEYYFKKRSLKNYFILLVPILCAVLCMTVSTDRNVFIRFGVYCLCLWILFFKNNTSYSRKKTNFKILKFTILAVIMMGLLFYGMGKIKQYSSDLERMIGIYGGSGLYNFNLYLENFHGDFTYGKSTFSAFLNVLASFNIIGKENIVEGPGFITFLSNNGYVYSSNIYSALQPFYRDFGILGIALFCFLIGMMLEFIYQRTEKNKFGYAWIFYAAFIYPTIYMALAEQFFARLHLGIIYELFWLWFFYMMVYKRHRIFKTKIYISYPSKKSYQNIN